MFSKVIFSKFVKGSLYAALLLSICSCGLKIGEEPTRDREIVIAGPGCMNEVSTKIGQYFNGDSSEQEVKEFFLCLKGVFQQFGTYARGNDEKTYTPSELREFLQRFMKDREVSDQLLIDLVQLKSSLLGGPEDRLDREDLSSAIQSLDKFEEMAQSLRPHMELLSLKDWRMGRPVRVSPANLDLATEAFHKFAMDLGQVFYKTRKPYHLASFKSLIREFRKFSQWEQTYPNSRSVELWAEFFKQFKVFSSGGDPEVIAPGEWQTTLRALSGWYMIVLRVNYDFKVRPVFFGEGREKLSSSANEIIYLLERAIDSQARRVISHQQFGDLVKSLESLRWLPFGLSAKSVSEAFVHLTTKILGDIQVHPSKRASRGLTRFNLAHAAAEFERWSEIQKFLDKTFQQEARSWTSTVGIQTIDQVFKLNSTGLADPFLPDIRMMAQRNRPLFRVGLDRVFLVQETALEEHAVVHGFYNLSIMNLIRAVVSVIFRGYSWSIDRLNVLDAGLTSKELQSFYEDFKNGGVDLEILDSRGKDAGTRSFMEANLFTYSGDGMNPPSKDKPKGHLLRYEELVELFSFLYSGGQLANEFFALGEGSCPIGPVDFRGKPRVGRKCLVEKISRQLPELVPNMPGLQKEYQKWGTVEQEQFVEMLYSTVLSPQYSHPKWAELAEMSAMATILHYSEAIMTRYDLNQDSILKESEIDVAFLTFRDFIKGMGEGMCQNLGDTQALEVFKFILKYSRVPSNLIDFGLMKGRNHSTWDLEINRQGLMTAFSTVIRAMNQSAAKGGKSCESWVEWLKRIIMEKAGRQHGLIAPYLAP